MVASPAFYSNTRPTVHDCAHLDTCEYVSDEARRDAELHHLMTAFRICRACGQKDQILNVSNYRFSVLNRPRDFVTKITRDEYLAIERSFNQKKPEYRERVLRQIREVLDARVLTVEDARQILEDYAD